MILFQFVISRSRRYYLTLFSGDSGPAMMFDSLLNNVAKMVRASPLVLGQGKGDIVLGPLLPRWCQLQQKLRAQEAFKTYLT